jgi:hypothetical protein
VSILSQMLEQGYTGDSPREQLVRALAEAEDGLEPECSGDLVDLLAEARHWVMHGPPLQ